MDYEKLFIMTINLLKYKLEFIRSAKFYEKHIYEDILKFMLSIEREEKEKIKN